MEINNNSLTKTFSENDLIFNNNNLFNVIKNHYCNFNNYKCFYKENSCDSLRN